MGTHSGVNLLSRVHVALALVSVLLVPAAMALEAHCSATDEADGCVKGQGVAALACEGSMKLSKERVEDYREACDAVDGGVFEDDAAVELGSGVRVAVMGAPACQARLECVLRGEIRERWDSEHREESRVLAALVPGARERGRRECRG